MTLSAKNTYWGKHMGECLKSCVEELYSEELDVLRACCQGVRPDGWMLTPAAVRDFILGRTQPLVYQGKRVRVSTKFFGNDDLVSNCISTLASGRNVLLAGLPGTGKSWLSELLAAAVSNNSRNIIQGTAALKPSVLRYTWNCAVTAAVGYVPDALIPAPLFRGMQEGIITRFEEISRTCQEVQDTLLSILSRRHITIHEFAQPLCLRASGGFAVIATANTADPGTFPGQALQALFDVYTVEPVRDTQVKLRMMESEVINSSKDRMELTADRSMLDLVMSVYDDIRSGSAFNELQGHQYPGFGASDLSAVAAFASVSSAAPALSPHQAVSCPVKNLVTEKSAESDTHASDSGVPNDSRREDSLTDSKP